MNARTSRPLVPEVLRGWAALLAALAWIICGSSREISAQGSLIVSISHPAAGSTVSGTTPVTATVTITGTLIVAGVQFTLDGVNLGAEDTSSPYSISWNTKTTSNGSHTLRAVARGVLGGQWTSEPVTVTVFNDTTPPTVGIATPAGGATLAGAIIVNATAADNVAVVGVQFRLNGAPLGAEDTAAPWATSWDTRTATNGSHALTAVARDAAGNTTTSTAVTVTVDNAAPTVTLTAPAAGATVSSTITVSAGASDNVGVAGVQFRLDGVALGAEDTTAPYAVSWDTRTAANGAHALTAIARDAAGNTTTSTAVTVTVDNAAPTVTLTAPAAGATVSSTITVSAGASDNVGVAGVQFRLDGVALGAEDTTAPYAVSWDTRTAANGAHTLTAVARDAAGNTTTSGAVTVTVDNTVPDTTAPTVTLTAPAAGATVSSTITVSAGASDNVGVAGVQFRLDGVALGAEDTTAPYAVSWDTRTAANGAHTLTAVARDAAGNTTTSGAVTVTVDNTVPDTTAPTVTLTAPAAGATVSSTITVSAGASDNVGVAGVQFRLDGVALGAEDTTAPYAVSWDTRTAANGAHALTAVARDAAGNTTTSGAVTVTVDNTVPDTTAPTVSLTAPAGGATVSGTITATADASDNVGVAGVRFRLDGADLGAEDMTAPYSVAWDTRTATNGAHTLTAVARDAAGNTTTSGAVTVTVDNTVPDTTAPTVSLTAPAGGATVSGTITVTADASDNVGVAGVRFRLDGADLGAEDMTAPYSVAWDTGTATNGAHTLTAIARDAAGNTTTSGAVAVTVSNSGTVTRVEETSLAIAYTGDWIQGNAGRSWSGGTAALGFATGHVAQFTFSGTGVTWLGWRAPMAGIARVVVDGGPPTTIDAYAETETVSAVMFTVSGLANGTHVLRIEVTGDKNPAATDRFVVVDAFDVTGSGGVGGDTTPPAVSVTSPAGGATVSGTVTVSADASDNVGVTGVQFRLDGVSLGAEDLTAPYTVSWDTRTATNGSHTLTASARDAAGNSTTSAIVTVTVNNGTPDTTAPAVSLTAPASGATVSAIITVSADASDNVGVAGVQFRLDGAAIGAEDTTSPYAVPWDTRNTANGSHTLTAVARDAAGNSTTSAAVTVTVTNAAGSTIRLEDGNTAVSYQGAWNQGNTGRPWSGGTAAIGFTTGQQATLDFRGTGVSWIGFRDNWAGIANVYVDGVFAAAVDAYAPTEAVGVTMFTRTGLAQGLHTLTIEVTRTKNPSSTDFVVIVDAFDVIDTPPDTIAPSSVTITSPSGGATVFGSVPITATASDDTGVAGMTFFVDGTQLGATDSNSPYSINWNTATVADGTHTLTAVARDAAGNTTASTPVTVIVSNAAPPVTANATRIENTSLSITYTDGCTTCGQVPAWFHGSRSRDWSGGTASFNRSDGARATFAFTGTAVKWIGFRAGWAGIARVFVDGAFVSEIDLYSVTEEPRVPVFQVSDLAPGITHTIAIESTGRRNAEASDYAVVVDAFDVSPATPPPPEGTRFEETSAAATFTPGWTQGDTAQPWSGGTAAVSSTAGERVAFVFTGTSVHWIGRRAPNMGIARVYLDGVFQATVDTYAPLRVQTVVYTATGLEPAQHRLEVEVTGLRNTNATDHGIAVDAFDVVARLEDNDVAVTYTGTWGFDFTDRAWSGTSLNMGSGTVARSATPGARAEFRFSGTSVSWIGYRASWVGIADVYLDGVFAARIDFYSPTEQVQAAVFTAAGLTPGTHTLRIEITGERNPASTSAWVMVDAFDVTLLTPALPVTRVQETDSRIAYTGAGWRAPGRSALWSGETAMESVIAGERATFTFTGTSVRWLGERGFGTGVARVLVDGVFIAQVDARTSLQEEYQRPLVTVTGLTPGSHTLTVEVIGRNNEAPGTTVDRIVIDAFDIK